MEVSQHGVTAPPPHNMDGVWVHPHYEERHSPSLPDVACAEVCRGETNGGSGVLYEGAGGRSDFGSVGLLPFMLFLDGSDGGVAGGAVPEKVRHLVAQGHHRITLEVPCTSVPDWFSFDPIILGRKQETDKIFLYACVRTGGGRVEMLPPEEELNVFYAKGVTRSVGPPSTIFS